MGVNNQRTHARDSCQKIVQENQETFETFDLSQILMQVHASSLLLVQTFAVRHRGTCTRKKLAQAFQACKFLVQVKSTLFLCNVFF